MSNGYYIVFKNYPNSDVYLFEPENASMSIEDALQFCKEQLGLTGRIRIDSIEFMIGNESVLDKEVILVEDLLTMKFLVEIRKYGIKHISKYVTRGRSPYLDFSMQGLNIPLEWQRQLIEYLLKNRKEKFIHGDIHEEAFEHFGNIISLANRLNGSYLNEILALFFHEFYQPDNHHVLSVLLSYQKHFAYSDEFPQILSPLAVAKYNMKGDFPSFQQIYMLLHQIESRCLHLEINSLEKFGRDFIPSSYAPYQWLFTEDVTRITAFLEDDRLDSVMIKRLMRRPRDYHHCFLSFALEDEDFTNKLVESLEQQGIICWYSRHDLKGGIKLKTQIEEAIRSSDKLVVVLSSNSIASDFVIFEVATALKKNMESSQSIVIPITLVPYDDYKDWHKVDEETGIDVSSRIKENFVIHFTGWQSEITYARSLNRLLDALYKGK